MSDEVIGNRRLLPQLGGFYGSLAPYSYAFMRLWTGLALLPHGIQKLFFGGAAATAKAALGGLGPDLPLALAYATGCVELFGALFLEIGLLTRLAALAITVEMTVIVFLTLWPNGYFWTNRGFEYVLLRGPIALACFFHGVGRYSVDLLLPCEL